MEMQEMIERLLAGQAKAEADITKDREQMLAEIRADRTKDRELMLAIRQELNANTKAMQEKADAGQAEIIAAIEKKTDAWIANARKETTACQEVTGANPEKMEPNLEEKETVLERHEIPNEEVAVQSQKTCRSETAASQEATETEPDPGTMQSVEEHPRRKTPQ
jgi:hypothetical protein